MLAKTSVVMGRPLICSSGSMRSPVVSFCSDKICFLPRRGWAARRKSRRTRRPRSRHAGTSENSASMVTGASKRPARWRAVPCASGLRLCLQRATNIWFFNRLAALFSGVETGFTDMFGTVLNTGRPQSFGLHISLKTLTHPTR